MSTKNVAKKSRKVAETIDVATKARRAVLAKMRQMSSKELFELAVRAGIYDKNGRLTRPYRDDTTPSASRPTD